MAKSLGDKVRYFMSARDISGSELAKLIDVRASYVSEIINDHKVPSVEVLKSLGKVLRVDPGYFISERDVLPEDVDGLPAEFLEYLLKDDKKEFLRIAKELDEKNLPADTIRNYLKAIDIIDKANK